MKNINIDNGGVSAKFEKVEFYTNMDWDGVLSRISDQETIICTYGNPDSIYNPYFRKHLPHMSNVSVINGTNSKFNKEEEYKNTLLTFNPKAHIYVKTTTHAKALLVAPDEVYITSQNVGDSDWFQVTVHIIDKGAFEYYKKVIISYAKGEFDKELTKECPDISFLAPEKQTLTNGKYNSSAPISLDSVSGKLFKMPNWNAKFNNITDRHFTICTFSLPDYEYMTMTVNKLLKYNNSVTLVVNSKFADVAKRLYEEIDHKDFDYICNDSIHAKLVLCDNYSVWISSHNFGKSHWFETMFQVKKCHEVYKYFCDELDKYLYKDITINDLIFQDED